ncbi:MAG: hypothetical protein J1F14_01490 [Treponema sp.]|nr:hypothetical protein [Treponema sp.]
MKKGSFFASTIILLVLGAAVFFIGWVQFFVKPGYCGVMTSKTSGIYPKPIVSGEFTWRWERLLPTNTELRVFSLAPYKSRQSVSGALPSAELYAAMLSPKPDFSYRADMSVTIQLTPGALVEAVRSNDFKEQVELDAWLENKVRLAAQNVTTYLMRSSSEQEIPVDIKALSAESLKEISLAGGQEFNGVDIIFVELHSAKVPDYSLYESARSSYRRFQERVDSALADKAREQANFIAEEERTLKQLDKFGELLQRYPQLEELSKSGNITEVINALRSLR